jgi:crooked neck
MQRPVPVKNKQPAATQITAEQILRESKSLQADEFQPPVVKITDPEELAQYRMTKRKEFEDNVRRVGRWNGSIWVKYAQWEEQQKDFRRARSVWERALEADSRNTSIWLKYAEMEMRHRFVNHARNVWDRAVTILPRIDQLWYKYIHMEEMLGNVPGARQIFERWMQWEPDHHGWMAYIKMELRYGEVDRARGIYERYVKCIPSVKAWVRYAKFEMKNANPGLARQCYERALEELSEDDIQADLYIKFAEFEEMLDETERARAIYKYALEHFGKNEDAAMIRQRYMAFEKQRGDKHGIEDAIFVKRREEYESELKKDPLNYDLWFDLTRLEEEAGDLEKTRNAYEMAIAALPPNNMEKRYWQRYIYIWIKYALFEELVAGDMDRTREVYKACLKLIPHQYFTFAKVWIMAAQFEIRQHRLDAARKIFGMAIGMCPKNKLFRSYIEMELSLGNIDRCRTLYEKHLEFNPASAAAWGQFAELEAALGETERARALYEIAISQPEMDMPEALWKAYIDFEISEGSRKNARAIYERLLEKTQHVKVWLSYAKFEATPLNVLAAEQEGDEVSETAMEEDEYDDSKHETIHQSDRIRTARGVYSRGFKSLRELQADSKEEAVMVLEAWRKLEKEALEAGIGSQEELSSIEKKMPKRVKRKRPIELDDGTQVGGMEEYYDYIFPDEETAAPNLKILEAAYKWKKQKLAQENAE